MRTLCFVALVLGLQIVGSLASLAIERPNLEKLRGHPHHCYATQDNIGLMKHGELRQIPGQCSTARCESDSSVVYTGCSPMAVQPPCVVESGDLNDPFPKCCHKIRCPPHDSEGKIVNEIHSNHV